MAELDRHEQEKAIDQAIRLELEELGAACAAAGAVRAGRFIQNERERIVAIAIRARSEPKKRELPSPFIYSMQ